VLSDYLRGSGAISGHVRAGLGVVKGRRSREPPGVGDGGVTTAGLTGVAVEMGRAAGGGTGRPAGTIKRCPAKITNEGSLLRATMAWTVVLYLVAMAYKDSPGWTV